MAGMQIPRERRPQVHAGRVGALLLLAGTLAGASPSGCNGWDNVGVLNAHLDASSPDAQDASFENPVLVTRDNPWFVGAFFSEPGVSSEVGPHAYSAHGHWNGLEGAVELEELWSPTVGVAIQQLPILPLQPYQGPGQATWGSRSGDLVHGNVYGAELHASDGSAIDSKRRLYARLAPEVRLVPVVVISWKKAGSDPSFIDHTHVAKSLFDFIPYDAPRHQPSELSPSGVLTPNHPGHGITPPTLWETPPDDVWTQCGVQFQVVTSYVFELPSGYSPKCNANSTTFPYLPDVQSRIEAADPVLGSAIVDLLAPIYVAYGDFGTCAGAQGYTGKVVGGLPLVEVHYARTRVTTSHEIGHVLLGAAHASQNGAPIQGNLMRVNPSDGDTDLTAAQCEKAREAAEAYDERYRSFNRTSGRTNPGIFAGGFLGGGGQSTGPASLDELPRQCCKIASTGVTYAAAFCGIGATLTADAECQTCCANDAFDDAATSWEDDCPEPARLGDAECEEICCSEFDPSQLVSRYACSQAGGHEIRCDLRRPR
jgi:hypothetical protein